MKTEKTDKIGKEWLKRETRPYRASVLFLTFFTVLSTVLSLAFAYMVRYVINSAADGKNTLLWIFSATLLGLLLLRILIKTIDGFFAEKLRAKIVAEQRTKVFSKILRSDYAKLQEYHSGELLNRLTTDIGEFAGVTVGLLPAFAGMLIQCLGAVAALLTIDPLFTCIYVVCGGIFGALAALFRRQIKKRQKEVLQADGESRSFMQEGLSASMTLKAYGAEEKTAQKSKIFADAYYDKRMKRNVLRSWMGCIFTLLSNFGLIFAVVWSAVSVLNGNDDYGSILSVILLLMQFQHPLSAFSSLMPAYYALQTSGERLAELDNLPCEEITATEKQISYSELKKIVFENVGFTYGRETVLESADCEIHKGEIVCLTGASGTGKSTLFKLLLNVYRPTHGEVYLQGETRERLTAAHRGLFAYVPQGNFLFSGTIYENLTFFTTETDQKLIDEKLKTALKTACAEFVWELPEGLNTSLSENGGGLSEGQLQRLAVARAVLSDRPILLLDEATSALDGETEKALLENVKNLQGKTCLIVTHRPAALAIADGILHIENRMIIRK
ncbi:MAG: ABC transporter ATP-binding protein [Clostridia bacterium]|nr:ABC transporter ATP-binding protein [Clostridia bacterium]